MTSSFEMTNERLIYFAGSIRGGRDDHALYFEIIEQLRHYGAVLTEHVGDEGLGVEGENLNNRQIHDRDIEWLKRSEFFVADVTTPSLGVGYEIGKAAEWGKPILCLFRQGEGRVLSAMIAGCKDVVLREYRTSAEINNIFEKFFLDVRLS
jgi:nucleoside 2-deoxyribosyltransferase